MLSERLAVVDVEAMAGEARRRALLAVVRAHPEWTLEQVLARSKAHADLLASLTMREIWGYDPRGSAGLPPLRPCLYERAARLHGEKFDSLVFDVLLEAERSVQTRYLRARLGGPRWKVKSSLERLCAEGFVVREGATSDTYYRLSLPEGHDG